MLVGQVGRDARGAGKSGPGHAEELNVGAGTLGALKSNSGMGALLYRQRWGGCSLKLWSEMLKVSGGSSSG